MKSKILISVNLLSFSTMSVEILASRMLAPFVGSSVLIWTNIIGIILIAISVGYWIGGKLAQSQTSPEVLFKVSMYAGVTIGILPIVTKAILQLNIFSFIQPGAYEIIVSFLAAGLGFGIPVLLFSSLSPLGLKLLTDMSGKVGEQAGKMYASTTLSSLLGIYLTTFFLIPYIGIIESIGLISLFIVAINGFFLSTLSFKNKIVAILLVIAITYIGMNLPVYSKRKQIFEKESAYQRIAVYEDTNATRSLVFDRPEYVQSIYNPYFNNSFGLYQEYIPYLLYKRGIVNKPRVNILILGYAGGYAGKLLYAFKPNDMEIQIDGVEIDPEVVDISKQYFGVRDDERNIFIEDARTYVSRNKNKKYDAIFVDLYNKDIFIPPHLVTKEFFNDLHKIMEEDGVVAFNINSRSSNSLFLQKIHAGLRQSFPFTSQSPVNNYNYLVTAGNSEPRFKISEEELNNFPSFSRDFVTSEITLFDISQPDNYFSDNKNDSELLTTQEFVLSK